MSTILKRLFEIRKEKKLNIYEFIFNILFKIVFNDLLITRSRRSERSHHHYGEIVEDIIDHDLKENITSKLADMYLTTANSNIFGSSALGHLLEKAARMYDSSKKRRIRKL